MASIFSRIAAGTIPAYKVAENDEFVAFLDANPLMEGHTLIVPRQEVDYFFDLESDLLGRMMAFSKIVAVGIKKAVPCLKIGVMVVGLEVAHAHIHLVPINSPRDMIVTKKTLSFSKEEFEAVATKIKSEISV